MAPARPPWPFRGKVDLSSEALPFLPDLEGALEKGTRPVWNVVGSSGMGKTLLGRWIASRWARRLLEGDETAPGVLWLERESLRQALGDDRAATGGPFVFALAASIPAWDPVELARLLARRRFVIIVDRDSDRLLDDWQLVLPAGLPDTLGVLHLSLSSTLGGSTVRLEPWDHETALLAAHAARGHEGVERLEALARSPLAALARHPLLLDWLWQEPEVTLESIGSGAVGFQFLEAFRDDDPPSRGKSMAAWAARILAQSVLPTIGDPIALPARRLHCAGKAFEVLELRRTFEALLLLTALEEAEPERLLGTKLIDEAVLDLAARLPFAREVLLNLERCRPHGPIASSNVLSLSARLRSGPPSEHHWSQRTVGADLRGQDLSRGIPSGTCIVQSNLSGAELAAQTLRQLSFEETDLSGANLSRVRVRESSIVRCRLDLTDLSGAELVDCELRGLDLSESILGHASLRGCRIESVTFGATDVDRPVRFVGSSLQMSRIEALAPAGLFLESSTLHDMSLEEVSPRALEAEGATFRRTSFSGLKCHGARLRKATFQRCILSDVSLVGADLRGAMLDGVDFQPGPGTRSSHTDVETRDDALFGSKSGFYAEDSLENVYLDPDTVRTADLRDADLRAVVIRATNLFRVDLRGARMDPPLRAAAASMGAFLE